MSSSSRMSPQAGNKTKMTSFCVKCNCITIFKSKFRQYWREIYAELIVNKPQFLSRYESLMTLLWKGYAIRTRFIATKSVVGSDYDTLINIHCGKSENSPYHIARNFPLCCAHARIENRTMRNTTKCPSLFILYSVHRSLAITRKYRNN